MGDQRSRAAGAAQAPGPEIAAGPLVVGPATRENQPDSHSLRSGPIMRLRRIARWWPLLPVAVAVLIVIAAWPGRYTFTVSPETTYVTGPLDAEGFVDYPA